MQSPTATPLAWERGDVDEVDEVDEGGDEEEEGGDEEKVYEGERDVRPTAAGVTADGVAAVPKALGETDSFGVASDGGKVRPTLGRPLAPGGLVELAVARAAISAAADDASASVEVEAVAAVVAVAVAVLGWLLPAVSPP